jgi:hypothetical protein
MLAMELDKKRNTTRYLQQEQVTNKKPKDAVKIKNTFNIKK